MLRRKFKCLKKYPADVTLNPVLHPSKLMDIIRGKIMSENQLTEECLGSQKGSPSDSLAENINVSNSEENTSVQGTDLKHQSSVKISSQEGHANRVIFDKGIALVPEMGGFIVKGENNKLYAVKLFPKESCQCPATGRCYHIIAARKSINVPTESNKIQEFNLNKLQKRSRKRADKKSGRKKPRVGDLDNSRIFPASDSILQTLDESNDNDDSCFAIDNFTESTPKHGATCRTPKSILKNNPTDSESRKSLRFEKKNPHQNQKLKLK